MSEKRFITVDGNEAAAYTAYRYSEVIAIYPITPSSPMGEFSDEWASKGIKNIWGTVPTVYEMQSEGGAAGAVHGALQAGALTTTFTASQGLLLKIPNMYKIAGELTPTVFNISARTLSSHALSIFGDHSDINAARQTGFAFLASSNVQEIMDMGAIAWASTLRSRIPFLHFFDGFRTSHEVQKIEVLSDDVLRQMVDYELVKAHRERALSPDHPVLRGTAQNPDVFFQNRETANKFYEECPDIVQEEMDKFARLTGRQYHLYDYFGDPNAENVIVIMASGGDVARSTVDYLNAKLAKKVGVLLVHLYRPFSIKHFVSALPKTTKNIAVLDRTKEPGASGEPLYLDVVDAIYEAMQDGIAPFERMPKIIGGRYGLSSKEFTPAMVKSIFDNLDNPKPKKHFTIGIKDDLNFTSLDYDASLNIESDKVFRGLFYGLGSDGTVGANKNSIKIIGENTDFYCQGYFEYDSKKSGSITISHLRFGPEPIRSPYKITHANFVACHQTVFLEKYDLIKDLIPNGVFLLNTPFPKDEVWDSLPKSQQEQIIKKNIKVYAIDAQKVAEDSGMGRRINTIMQTCFFAISGVLPKEQAIEEIKKSIRKTYGRKGEHIVQMNLDAVDNTLANLFEIPVPSIVTSKWDTLPPVAPNAPEFVKKVEGEIIALKGDNLPVSVFPVDGTWPTATSQYEKRNIALEIPVWDESICIQCGKCALVCPHASIRIKVYDPKYLENVPPTFKSMPSKDYKGEMYSIQIAPEDCTGCKVCVESCPVTDKKNPKHKALDMYPQMPLREQEKINWDFFLSIPDKDRSTIQYTNIRQQQIQRPLFEFSGACAGCGETPYIKPITQLFGERMMIANATGCSSIYGGSAPATPYTYNLKSNCGPAWANSLFEDNAEYGFGMFLGVDKLRDRIADRVKKIIERTDVASEIKLSLKEWLDNKDNPELSEKAGKRVIEMIEGTSDQMLKEIYDLRQYLTKKSIWIFGGDGWAYDIGYGGLDHVLASGKNVNILV
ncbi:MAG TPA: pyruvate:ferredoxin (flavodoxin) oxidoreductase, partial [Candidatus Kapabacteria bacterium]|nr:pyruvate:ferredoxin (flavodoxin) oxidoreductase [Candidatus Kapabacteria bacterium]